MRELIYGRNAVHECLRAGRRDVFRLLVSQGAQASGTLAQALVLARQKGVPVQQVLRPQLDKIAQGHQGIVAEVSGYPYVDLEDLLQPSTSLDSLRLLVLDCLQDPQNLGALLRTAEAVGVDGVVIARDRAASVTPAVANASSGATEHLRIARVTNITRTLQTLKEYGVWIAGLEDAPGAQEYWNSNLTGSIALVVGSEGQGIRRLVLQTCDVLVKLPMRGKVTSLNAAVAGSIVLYETFRQSKK